MEKKNKFKFIYCLMEKKLKKKPFSIEQSIIGSGKNIFTIFVTEKLHERIKKLMNNNLPNCPPYTIIKFLRNINLSHFAILVHKNHKYNKCRVFGNATATTATAY